MLAAQAAQYDQGANFFFFKEITSQVKCCNQKELLVVMLSFPDHVKSLQATVIAGYSNTVRIFKQSITARAPTIDHWL
jgi:hypothetical protein